MKRMINIPRNRVTFKNDEKGAPSPNLPVSAILAKIIEDAVMATNFTININSSSGGVHSSRSFHYHGMAVDINLIQGKRVDDKSNEANVRRLQTVLANNPSVGECYGPFINIRKRGGNVEQKHQWFISTVVCRFSASCCLMASMAVWSHFLHRCFCLSACR